MLLCTQEPKLDVSGQPSGVRGLLCRADSGCSVMVSIRLFSPPRIAIFQAYWRLHSNVVYLALLLSKKGYGVDVFLLDVDEWGQESVLESAERVCIYRISHRRKLDLWISQLDYEGTQSYWRSGIRCVTQFGLRAIRYILHRIASDRDAQRI